MDRRAFLKLAGVASGAFSVLGLLPKQQDPAFRVLEIGGATSKESPLGPAFNPADHKGEWTWVNVAPACCVIVVRKTLLA